MGVAERLARARAAATVATHTAGAATGFLPLCTVQDYIVRHPLFHASGADLQTIHKIMVALRGCDDATEAPAREPLPASWRGSRRDANACRECGAAVELHARDGDVVCTSCGVVSPEVVFGVGYEDSDEPQWCGAAERKGVHALVVAPSPYDYTERLEHWNHYARLPKSRCQRAARLLSRSHPRRPDRLDEVVCAALLYELMKDELASEGAVRERLAQGKGVDAFQSKAPTRRMFVCPGCGAEANSAKGARFHCRWKM